MDTNVFISRLQLDDPFHPESKLIVNALLKGQMQSETSVLTLLEIASVAGRLYTRKKMQNKGETEEGDEEEEKKRKIFIFKTLERLASLKTKFINIPSETPMTLKGLNATLPVIFNEGIMLSLQISLRTLDLVHLAAARYARRMNNELVAFVTGDKDFLSKKRELYEIVGMPVLSPREYVEGFGIGE